MTSTAGHRSDTPARRRHRASAPTSYRPSKTTPTRRGTRRRHPALVAVPATALSVALLTGAFLFTTASTEPGPQAAAAVQAPTSATATATLTPAPIPSAPVVAAARRISRPQAMSRTATRESVEAIPDLAVAAYQRAQTVMADAAKGCDLSWTLLAAVGRVTSDHGQVDGSTLNDDGIAQPSIFGAHPAGRDTDAGQYDGDRRHDRTVGPMQFLPTTWSVVGLDADGDGSRNPQDIDDAALAAEVLLCGDQHGNLSKTPAQRAALARYNPAPAFARKVLAIARGYEADLADALLEAEAAVPEPVEITVSVEPSATSSAEPTTAPTAKPPKTPHPPKPTKTPKPPHPPSTTTPAPSPSGPPAPPAPSPSGPPAPPAPSPSTPPVSPSPSA